MALLMPHSAHDRGTLALLIGHRCDECLSIYVGSTSRQCQAEAYLELGSFSIKHCPVSGGWELEPQFAGRWLIFT